MQRLSVTRIDESVYNVYMAPVYCTCIIYSISYIFAARLQMPKEYLVAKQYLQFEHAHSMSQCYFISSSIVLNHLNTFVPGYLPIFRVYIVLCIWIGTKCAE